MGMETIIILLLAIFSFINSQSWIHLRLLNEIYRSSLWEQRTTTISSLLLAYGILFLFLAALSFISNNKGQSITARFLSALEKEFFSMRKCLYKHLQEQQHFGNHLIWLGLFLAIAVGLRIYFLPQPMRGDEAYTFLKFVNGENISLFEYPVPNNHVLNTLMIKVSTFLWGASPAIIRLPAFLAGIAAVPLTFFLAREQNPRPNAGFLSSLIIAIFPYLVLYSTNARGYSLVVMFTLICAFIALNYVKHPTTWGGTVRLALISALGLWAIPSMVFSIAGISIWLVILLFLKKRPLRIILLEFAIPFSLLCAIFAFILYTPVILASNGIQQIIANKFVESQTWIDFSLRILPGIRDALFEITRDVPPVILITWLVLMLISLLHAFRNRDWITFLQIPAFIFGAIIILLMQHSVPYSRIWIYLLPFIFILADYGFTILFDYLPSGWQLSTKIGLALLGCFFSLQLISNDVITQYPDTSAFPEAQLVAQYLKPILHESDIVRVSNTADWPVYFYFWYYHVPYQFEEKPANPSRIFIVIKKSRYSIEDMTDKPVIRVLDFENMSLYQVNER